MPLNEARGHYVRIVVTPFNALEQYFLTILLSPETPSSNPRNCDSGIISISRWKETLRISRRRNVARRSASWNFGKNYRIEIVAYCMNHLHGNFNTVDFLYINRHRQLEFADRKVCCLIEYGNESRVRDVASCDSEVFRFPLCRGTFGTRIYTLKKKLELTHKLSSIMEFLDNGNSRWPRYGFRLQIYTVILYAKRATWIAGERDRFERMNDFWVRVVDMWKFREERRTVEQNEIFAEKSL